MEFLAAKCPNCGGDLRLPDNLETAKCMYCGVEVIVRNAVRAAETSVKNLLKIASSALTAKNSKEAYEYFTKVLEFEPNNYVALLGKAEAAGRLSTATNFRIDELTKGANTAVENAPEQKKDEIKPQIAEMLHQVCLDYSRLLIGNKSDEAEIQRAGIIDCLEFAHKFAPENVGIIESIIHKCDSAALSEQASKARANVKLLEAGGKFSNSLSEVYDSQIAFYNKKKESYLSKLENLAPEKVKQYLEEERQTKLEIEKMSASGCATMSFIFILIIVALTITFQFNI